MMNIAILCPSRGRPERYAFMVESARAMAIWQSRLSFLVMVDADDPCRADYVQSQRPDVTVLVNERRQSAPALYNELATRHAAADILVAASDDVLFRTSGWDCVLEDKVRQHADGLCVLALADSEQRPPNRVLGAFTVNGVEFRCEHFATTRRWVETVGYFMRGEYEHFAADHHVGAVAHRLGRLVPVPSVVLEHMHFKYGKAAKDENYAEKRREAVHRRDEERFLAYAGERAAAAERVRAAMLKFGDVA